MLKLSKKCVNVGAQAAIFTVFLMILIWITSKNLFEEYVYTVTLATTTPEPVKLINPSKISFNNHTEKLIIVVTPTYRRLTRIPDITRMANTLSHITNFHWIVIEDGTTVIPSVLKILEKSNINFTYLAHKSPKNSPNRGWFQRNKALKFLRKQYRTSGILERGGANGVVYFGDDDNTYDLRLFTDYIRNVKRIGMWGVGFVSGSLVESPRVFNGKVIGFDAEWNPNRYFAIDKAGFALGIQLILNSNVEFRSFCPWGSGKPESCLLEDLRLKREDVEPFGLENEVRFLIF
ncbi:hypothetical protein B9Z55_003081 [Caenorhabditis nigoni]|uniref:Galactosylgalactosylxylosylprotein 3-beta-glucuronosyltransferase n=2 Tax=Caenorhabditis nigoni TaxID=1611254 RepID=A0A2G5VNE5_9PELO|nr:hypothetical protein B9Z55_003081 [Caenorhabditis nigoni]